MAILSGYVSRSNEAYRLMYTPDKYLYTPEACVHLQVNEPNYRQTGEQTPRNLAECLGQDGFYLSSPEECYQAPPAEHSFCIPEMLFLQPLQNFNM